VLRWLGKQEDPRSIGLFRIALGALLMANVATLWPHAAYLYGNDGVYPADEACHGLSVLSAMCWITGTQGAHVVLTAFFVAALAFTIGLRTGVAKWVTAYLYLSIVLRNGIALAGEQVFGNFLFLLCLSRCDAAYSVDAWRRPLQRIPAWPRYLMILQLCIAYGVAGWAKTGQTWVEGSALYYVLANDRWVRFQPWWLLATFGNNLLRVASWGAWWFERLFPLAGLGLLLGDRVPLLRIVGSRWIWVPLCVVFTGTLILLTNLGWFVPGTLAATIVLFRGEEIGRVIDRRSFVETPRIDPLPVTWRTRVLAAFIGWHALTMIVNALSLPHLSLPVPAVLRSATQTWGRLTNTFQFWGMFSRDAPRARSWLVVDVVTRDGDIEPAFDDRELIGERAHPHGLHDRRVKAHSNVLDRWRGAHARHVCRTWRDAEGHPPAEVVISNRAWPLPSPRWQAEHGPVDPRPHFEHMREDAELYRLPCAASQR
jgi:hypothetical protein